MVEIVNGSLFDSDAELIVHQVNCVGKMGAGVAKQVHDYYPHVYKEYIKYINHFLKHEVSPLGTAQFVPIHVWALPMVDTMKSSSVFNYDARDCQYIVNLFGQEDIGTGMQTDVNAFKNALMSIKTVAEAQNMRVAMPYKIACGHGGANWNDIFSIIKQVFDQSSVHVELWKLD